MHTVEVPLHMGPRRQSRDTAIPLHRGVQELTTTDDALPRASPEAVLFPTFDDDALAELAGFGHRRPISIADVLFEPGEELADFFVILEGEVELVRIDDESEAVIATFTPGQFVGGIGILTGQRSYLTARASRSGCVLEIDATAFRRL